MDVDVADARAGRERHVERIVLAQFGEERVEVDRLAAGMAPAFLVDPVELVAVRGKRAAPWRLEGQLDAVAVEVPEIGRLGDEMVGRRIAKSVLEEAGDRGGKVLPRRQVDGDVIEPGSIGDDRAFGVRVEDDERALAGAELDPVALARQHRQSDEVAPDAERPFRFRDRDMDRSEASGGRHEGGALRAIEGGGGHGVGPGKVSRGGAKSPFRWRSLEGFAKPRASFVRKDVFT